jgi:excisionase family DNA binding protein
MENEDLPKRQNLTVREVAAFLHVSLRSIYNLVSEGSLPHVRIGRVIRIPRDNFFAWYQDLQREEQCRT